MRIRDFVLIAPLAIAALWWFIPIRAGGEEIEVPHLHHDVDVDKESQVLTPVEENAARDSGAHAPRPAADFHPDPTGVPITPSEPNRLDPTEMALIHARLIDGKSGMAIPGAALHRVNGYESERWKPDPWKHPNPWVPEGKPIGRSDASGRLHIEQIQDSFAIYEVHAEGYGPAWVNQVGVTAGTSDPTEVQMFESATLYGYISGPVPGGFEGVSIGAYVAVEHLTHGPNLVGYMSTPILTWKAPCDVNGAFELSGLPSDVPLRLWVEYRDAKDGGIELLHLPVKSIAFQAGESRRFDWQFSKGHLLGGFALASNGLPRKNWKIVAVSKEEADTRKRLRGTDIPLRTTMTNENGFFQFQDLPRGHYLVGPAPPWTSTTMGVKVDVPSLEALLIQDPAMDSVRGTVTFESRPAPGVTVRGRTLRSVVTDVNGAFQLPCAVGETIQVICYGGPSGYVHFEGVSAKAGDRNVRIELQPAAELQVRAIHHATGEPISVFAELLRCDGDQGMTQYRPLSSSHTVSNLAQGRYVATASTPHGLAARSKPFDLAPGTQNEEVVLRLAPAGKLTIAAIHPEDSAAIHLMLGPDPVARCPLGSRPSEIWLPPGTYLAELKSTNPRLKLPANSISIVAGQTTELVVGRLSPRR